MGVPGTGIDPMGSSGTDHSLGRSGAALMTLEPGNTELTDQMLGADGGEIELRHAVTACPPREIGRSRNAAATSSSVTVGRGSGKRLRCSMGREHKRNMAGSRVGVRRAGELVIRPRMPIDEVEVSATACGPSILAMPIAADWISERLRSRVVLTTPAAKI